MKPTQNRPACVYIDRQAYQHNLKRVKELTPNASVMAVIKADAYGHGMEVAADALNGADEFAINSLDDVYRLRKHAVNKTLTVLSANVTTDDLNQLSSINVRPVFYDLSQLTLFEGVNPNANLSIWLKLDTGMGRLGVLVNELPSVYQRLSKVKGISSISVMTHLANADNLHHPSNDEQIRSFEQQSELFEFDQKSILHSAGVVNFSDKQKTIVRPGIMLYGISPVQDKSADELGLKPVMTFKSQLISVKQLPAGSSIGYGSTYSLEVNSRIGIVACGYGDGYPRSAPSGTLMLINGFYVPLVGRVSMDMLAVDLGELPAQVGDEVVLWGAGNPVEDVAKSACTIAYELCCGILPRVERVLI